MPGVPWSPDPGAVVDGLELAAGLGVGLAARAGTENATTAPTAAAPTTGAPSSSSLRLSGMFASCNSDPRVTATHAARGGSGSGR